ncbi:hypothetical protein CVS40_8006 [Lucilia cuprina]|nr:hypothetical protein CVS40_8006 [Lucilia cuprina]
MVFLPIHIYTCKQCSDPLPSNFVKCYNCNNNFHFNPCCPLSESTYSSMNRERRVSWRCHICKPRNKSDINNSYETVLYQDKSQHKQQRENDDNNNDQTKRFKDSISLNQLQSSICAIKADVKLEVNEVRSEITDVKNNIIELKTTIEQLTLNVSQNDISFKEEMKTALSQITATLSNLLTQMGEMREENRENKKEIEQMDMKINKLEQQMLSKKIEIKNIQNKEMQANDVIKTIAASINVGINDYDISDAYRLKKIQDKVIVEFTTHNKKREFMQRIKRMN